MRFRIEICVLALFVFASGCALFSGDAGDQFSDKVEASPERLAMKPLAPPAKKIVRLTSSVIVQPESENRVRETVWQQLCETCLQKHGARRRLNETGFRVGVTQPPYPLDLETLLNTSLDNHRRGRSGTGSQRGPVFFSASGQPGSPIVIPDDTDALVEVRQGFGAEIPDEVTIPGLEGIGPAEKVRCVLRIRTVDSGNGWSMMQFQPELHFGSQAMRMTVHDGESHLAVRPGMVPLFDQRFEVKLRPNDVVVLGYHPDGEWTTGRFFFQSDRLNGSQEHLLVLKISEIESVEGRPSVQVNYTGL